MAPNRRPDLRVRVAAWPLRRWMAVAAILAAAVVGALDRAGRLGGGRGDLARYDRKTFPVVRVIDGDTFELAVRDGRKNATRVRLWGVDTPERDAHFGPQAAEFARKRIQGRPVTVVLVPARTRDRYSRLLAYIYPADSPEGIAELLLETGHAYADPRFHHPLEAEYADIEARARKARVGLWTAVRPEQMPGWRRRLPDDRAIRAPR